MPMEVPVQSGHEARGVNPEMELKAGPFKADYSNPILDVVTLLFLFAGLLIIKKWLR